MDQSPDDTWFFTREGVRQGPVSFSDLRAKVTEAALDPRLDMVWKQGMEAWKPSGEIEGLFDKRTASGPHESLAPQPGPYAAPQSQPSLEEMGQHAGWPGARRRSYLFVMILFPVLWAFLFRFIEPFLVSVIGPEIMNFVGVGIALVPLIASIHFALMRLVNLGMSRWWILGNIVPFLNFWVGYRCFACPAGYAHHKKLDGPGIALAIFYWLMLVVVVAAVAAVVALMFGLIHSPELQDHLRDWIRTMEQRAAHS